MPFPFCWLGKAWIKACTRETQEAFDYMRWSSDVHFTWDISKIQKYWKTMEFTPDVIQEQKREMGLKARIREKLIHVPAFSKNWLWSKHQDLQKLSCKNSGIKKITQFSPLCWYFGQPNRTLRVYLWHGYFLQDRWEEWISQHHQDQVTMYVKWKE